MLKGLVVYDSKTGRTEKMAMAISQGMKRAGLDVEAKRVKNVSLSDLIDADAIVLGSPTYFATMSGNMKEFIDKSIDIYPDKLMDKVGAVFTSSGGLGEEMTLSSLILAMLSHRMIIVGHQTDASFGAISIGEPDKKCIAECQIFGERIAGFTKAIAKR